MLYSYHFMAPPSAPPPDCQVYSWGLNNQHQLALDTDEVSVCTPTLVTSLSALPVVQLSGGAIP